MGSGEGNEMENCCIYNMPLKIYKKLTWKKLLIWIVNIKVYDPISYWKKGRKERRKKGRIFIWRRKVFEYLFQIIKFLSKNLWCLCNFMIYSQSHGDRGSRSLIGVPPQSLSIMNIRMWLYLVIIKNNLVYIYNK